MPNLPKELFRLPTGRLAMIVSHDPPRSDEAQRATAIMQFWGIMHLDLLTLDELRDRYGDEMALDLALKRGRYVEVVGLDATSQLHDRKGIVSVGGERPLNRFERRSLGRR